MDKSNTLWNVKLNVPARSMKSTYQMWDEAKKYFAPGSKRHPKGGTADKDLALADVNLGEILTSKNSL